MLTAISSALTALNANSTAVSVVGDDLANLNTSGYKAHAVYFRDLMTSVGAGVGQTLTFGTARPIPICEFTQGTIQGSAGQLDAAIQGDGFFVIRNASGGIAFTRSGNFKPDGAGKLVTQTGQYVQGWSLNPATGKVDTNSGIGEISIPVGSLKPPAATKTISLDLNLNATVDAGAASNFSYPVQVYDTLGAVHTLTVTFSKTDANAWQYNVTIPGEDVGDPAGTQTNVATGALTFDDKGKLTSPASDAPIQFTIDGLADQAAPLDLTWNLYTEAGGPRVTQFSQVSTVSASSQDGSPPAQLTGVSIIDGGQIIARFSDDQQIVVGQLAMASIRNPDSLVGQGDNNFTLSAKTAAPVIGLPGTGGRGKVLGSATEASTVDVATEFTSLMVYQRAYQANSRVVTSADQLTQETINLIR